MHMILIELSMNDTSHTITKTYIITNVA